MRQLATTSLALALLGSAARADDCDGKPGWVLDVPDTAPIGSSVTINLDGPPNDMYLFMISLGEGPTSSVYGTICLDFPLVFSLLSTFDATGHVSFNGDLACDPNLIGLTLYMQFITCKPNRGVSNQDSLTITDGICDGDFASFTQGGWGTSCSGNNPGCRRDQWFPTIFPNGVTLGDADGIDGDGDFAAHFTSSAAVQDFVPAGGTPDRLSEDTTDPTSTAAGVFAGQLLAAKLNVAFDDGGAFDDLKADDGGKLGDLVYVAGVDADLIGWSVRDVIDLADLAISGALGAGPFDLDGNGSGDVTISDLSDALDVLNQNFDNGTQDNGNLAFP